MRSPVQLMNLNASLSAVQDLASQRTVRAAMEIRIVQKHWRMGTRELLYTFCLAVVAQEGRITYDTVKGRFQFGWEPDRVLELVVYELFEDGEAFVEFEEFDCGMAFVFP